MEEITGFGMKNRFTLPSLANKNFISLRDENEEHMYTYNDEYMRYFVRKSIKEKRCLSLNRHFNSSISDGVFNNISTELNVSGNKSEFLDKYFEYVNKHKKIIKEKHMSKSEDYRDIDKSEKAKHVNDKLSKLPKHFKSKNSDLNKVLIAFDFTSSYPFSMWDKNSVYPKIENGFAFKPPMNDVYVEAFIIQTFHQDGNESAILGMNF